jgi:hypothetical protein
MTLRDIFVITGIDREVSRKVSNNIGKVLKTPEMFRTSSKLYQ